MAKRLSASLVNLIHDCAWRSFWRRSTLQRFLRQNGVAESFLATWEPSETKRAFLDRLFLRLPDVEGGQELLLRIGNDLAQQDTFPDLRGWENSTQLIQDATKAVTILRMAMEKVHQEAVSERERVEARARLRQLHEEAARSQSSLAALSEKLQALSKDLGSSEAGIRFQDWFYELVNHFEIVHRRPYWVEGRQIDGSITLDGTTYLIEAKFTTEQAQATDIDSFLKKVTDKADNTMGIMVSISGYSGVAIAEASKPRTPLLLLDAAHVYLVLSGALSLGDLIDRVRRHASQTSEAYLPVNNFGG